MPVYGRLRGRHTLYELEELTVTIGRDEDNDIVLNVKGISRHQATLEFHSCASSSVRKFATITDQNSVNGTFVNGTRVHPRQPHRLVNGDIVVFSAIERESYRYETAGSIPSTLAPSAGGNTKGDRVVKEEERRTEPAVNQKGLSVVVGRSFDTAAGKPSESREGHGSSPIGFVEGPEKPGKRRLYAEQVSSSDLESPATAAAAPPAAAVVLHSPPRQQFHDKVMHFPVRDDHEARQMPASLQNAAAERRRRRPRRPSSASPAALRYHRSSVPAVGAEKLDHRHPPPRSRSAEPLNRSLWSRSDDEIGRQDEEAETARVDREEWPVVAAREGGGGLHLRESTVTQRDHFVEEMEDLLLLDKLKSGSMTMQERQTRIKDDMRRVQNNIVDMLIEKNKPFQLSESVREKEEAFISVIKELTAHRERFNQLLAIDNSADASSESSSRGSGGVVLENWMDSPHLAEGLSRVLFGPRSLADGSPSSGRSSVVSEETGSLPADLMKAVWSLREAERGETTCKRKWNALLAELRAQQQNIKVLRRAVDDKLSTPILDALEELKEPLTSAIGDKAADGGRTLAVILAALDGADRQHKTMQKRLVRRPGGRERFREVSQIQLAAKYEASKETLKAAQEGSDETVEVLRDFIIKMKNSGGVGRVVELNEALEHLGERCSAAIEENLRLRRALEEMAGLMKKSDVPEIVRRYLDGQACDADDAAQKKSHGNEPPDVALMAKGLRDRDEKIKKLEEEVLEERGKLLVTEHTVIKQSEEMAELLGKLRDGEAVTRRVMAAAAASRQAVTMSQEEDTVCKDAVNELLAAKDSRVAALEAESAALTRQLSSSRAQVEQQSIHLQGDGKELRGATRQALRPDEQQQDEHKPETPIGSLSSLSDGREPPQSSVACPFIIDRRKQPAMEVRRKEVDAVFSSEAPSSARVGDLLQCNRQILDEPTPPRQPFEDLWEASTSHHKCDENEVRTAALIDQELQQGRSAESLGGSQYGDDGISCLFDKRTESDAPDA
ncbi:hypothetical protein FOL47_006134 [Perkinsus chesapeaki]|uniref:FHA domain-containing protein n=1 Tax=Perkinsus chesapeaki TaxID=330153 RepID=A0A7J6MYG4_PERCH|nr:hypothetical protein FOL47_006134 [Perkinsus chesapeaki]